MRAILVVEDDEVCAQRITRVLGRYRAIALASTHADALAQMSPDLLGLLVDLDVDRNAHAGLELVQAAEARSQPCPAALLVSQEGNAWEGALAPGVGVIAKPLSRHKLVPFVQRVLAFDYGVPPQVANVVAERAATWRLSLSLVDILLAHIAGGGRDLYLDRRPVGLATYQSQVKEILARARAGRRMSDVTAGLLRRSIGA